MPETIANRGVAEQAKLTPEEELRLFRGLVRSLTCSAAETLDDLGMWCKDPEQFERCLLVQHYLDYLKRLCDGKV